MNQERRMDLRFAGSAERIPEEALPGVPNLHAGSYEVTLFSGGLDTPVFKGPVEVFDDPRPEALVLAALRRFLLGGNFSEFGPEQQKILRDWSDEVKKKTPLEESRYLLDDAQTKEQLNPKAVANFILIERDIL